MREAELIYKAVDFDRYTEGHTPLTFARHLHYVRGVHGAVSFVWREMVGGTPSPDIAFIAEPIGLDLAWHRATPKPGGFPGVRNDECQALGGPCYSDGSSLAAQRWLTGYLESGKDEGWLRNELAEYYHEVFYELIPQDSLDAMGFGEVLARLGNLLEGT